VVFLSISIEWSTVHRNRLLPSPSKSLPIPHSWLHSNCIRDFAVETAFERYWGKRRETSITTTRNPSEIRHVYLPNKNVLSNDDLSTTIYAASNESGWIYGEAVVVYFKSLEAVRKTMNGGSSPGGGYEFFFPPSRPDRLWGPPSFLSNGYRGKAAGTWSWPLTTTYCWCYEYV